MSAAPVRQPYACPRCFAPFAKWGACHMHVHECMDGLSRHLGAGRLQDICREASQLPRIDDPEVVHVEVSKISGQSFALDLSSKTTVQELKGLVGRHWQIPTSQQQLLLTSAAPTHWHLPPVVLHDPEQLFLHCRTGRAELSISLCLQKAGMLGTWAAGGYVFERASRNHRVRRYAISEFEEQLLFEAWYENHEHYAVAQVRGLLVDDGGGWFRADLYLIDREWRLGNLVEVSGPYHGTIRLRHQDGCGDGPCTIVSRFKGHECRAFKTD